MTYDIIPGITSSIAVPAYAGIPVTHRDFTSSVAIITGHEYPNKTYSSLNWEHLAKAIGTMVFLMGVANLEQICSELIRCGKPPEMPVALVRWGTWADQATITGTLGDITEKVREANFKSPAVIIVGEVVKLREKLAWMEKKPLLASECSSQELEARRVSLWISSMILAESLWSSRLFVAAAKSPGSTIQP